MTKDEILEEEYLKNLEEEFDQRLLELKNEVTND
jgi:hypothetical protein